LFEFSEESHLAVPYQVVANSVVYTVVDDCTTAYWALITGRITDEILGDFTAPGFAVGLSRNDMGTRTTEKGLYAVTGYPEQAFPQLSTTSYVVNLVLTAPGFRDYALPVTIPISAAFPVSAPVAAMRRLPVRIQGRVVNATTRAPISGATVVSVDDPLSPPPAVHTTALRTPLYFAHASAAKVQQVTMASGVSTTLQQQFLGGTQALNLMVRTGLGPNSILRISDASQTQVEYGIVASLGPGPAASPGQVFLRTPLSRTYPLPGTTVVLVTPTLVGASAGLSTDSGVGDGVLLTPQLFSGIVVIDAASPTLVEYHEVGALTDADGYYSLVGIGRIPEIFLKATSGALTQTRSWFVEFGEAINVLDFRL
jgi:hypothetical protein